MSAARSGRTHGTGRARGGNSTEPVPLPHILLLPAPLAEAFSLCAEYNPEHSRRGFTQNPPERGTDPSPPSLLANPKSATLLPKLLPSWGSCGDVGVLLALSLPLPNPSVPLPCGNTAGPGMDPSCSPGIPQAGHLGQLLPHVPAGWPWHAQDTEDDAPEAGGEGHAGIALPGHGEVGEGVCGGTKGDLGHGRGTPGRARGALGAAEPSPPMLLPQASSVRPSTVLLSWKMMPRVRRMFTSSVAAALIHMALAKNPRKANT